MFRGLIRSLRRNIVRLGDETVAHVSEKMFRAKVERQMWESDRRGKKI